MSVIQKILVLMEKEKVNARKLTTDLGLSNSCITEWKKGKAKPSIEAVVKIAGYFGVTTDYLLFDDSETGNESREKNPKPKGDDQLQNQSAEKGVCEAAGEEWESEKDRRLLDCYHRLAEEDREYIWCKMIVLEREAMD